MKSVNEVHLIGRAGRAPEVRYTSGSKKLASFSLATGGGKKKDGSVEWPTDWHSIKAWGSIADSVESEVRKGGAVEVYGRISYESWTDKQTGQKREKAVIVASEVNSVGDESRSESRPTRTTTAEVTDSDIPF